MPELVPALHCPVCRDPQPALESRGAGQLGCPGCGRTFVVENGIARLLPDALRTTDAPADQEVDDKRREMALRDRESGIYDAIHPDDLLAAELESYDELCRPAPGSRVLDLGCGTGRVAHRHLDPRVASVGADFSLASLRLFWRRCRPDQREHLLLVQADAAALPFGDAAFDQVTCLGMFHSLPGRAARDGALAELLRVLRPGGVCVLSLYNFCLARRVAGWLGLSGMGHKEGRKAPAEGGIYYYHHTAAEARAWLEPLLRIEALRAIDSRLPFLQQYPPLLKQRIRLRFGIILLGRRRSKSRLCYTSQE